MQNVLMALIFGILGSFALPAPSAAQSQTQEVTFVYCTQGAGCRCALSGMDAYFVASIFNAQEPPANADQLIMLTVGVETNWSALTPDQADEKYGGDGVCPIEVFLPPIPEDGTWVGAVRTTSVTGCAPQVAEMVPSMVGAMVFTRQIAWENKFHPAKLSSDPTSALVTWQELNPVLYSGTLNSPIKSDLLKVNGALSAKLTSPKEAIATLNLRIGAEGVNAEIFASIGMADCRTTAVYDFNKVD